MSRIGNQVINLPNGVSLSVNKDHVITKGPKGTLQVPLFEDIHIEQQDNQVYVKCSSKVKTTRAKHGLVRSLLYNSVVGTSEGFAKTLIIEGVGYRSVKKGDKLVLSLGYSHEIHFEQPKDVQIEVLEPTKLKISGIDKQRVGEVADKIRKFRPPEPYKGKGIRYEGEYIKRKAGKSAKK